MGFVHGRRGFGCVECLGLAFRWAGFEGVMSWWCLIPRGLMEKDGRG